MESGIIVIVSLLNCGQNKVFDHNLPKTGAAKLVKGENLLKFCNKG